MRQGVTPPVRTPGRCDRDAGPQTARRFTFSPAAWPEETEEGPMSSVDPVTAEIVRAALASTADEMALALYRTAYSTIVRDTLDFSTSLCDTHGRMIAQSVTIPLHMGSVPYAMATLFEKFGEQIEPGDIFILNDPFEGGMHIPDIFIAQPVFHEGKREAFAVATAHHL